MDSETSKIIKINLSGNILNNLVPYILLLLTFLLSKWFGMNNVICNIYSLSITDGSLLLIICLFLTTRNCGQQFFRLKSYVIRFCNVPYFRVFFSDKTRKMFNYKNLLTDTPIIVNKEIELEINKFRDFKLNQFLNNIDNESKTRIKNNLDYSNNKRNQIRILEEKYNANINKEIRKFINTT